MASRPFKGHDIHLQSIVGETSDNGVTNVGQARLHRLAEDEIRLRRRCLSQRIDKIEDLRRQAKAREKSRDEAEVKVNWQFTTADARTKLKRLYPSLEE